MEINNNTVKEYDHTTIEKYVNPLLATDSQ